MAKTNLGYHRFYPEDGEGSGSGGTVVYSLDAETSTKIVKGDGTNASYNELLADYNAGKIVILQNSYSDSGVEYHNNWYLFTLYNDPEETNPYWCRFANADFGELLIDHYASATADGVLTLQSS